MTTPPTNSEIDDFFANGTNIVSRAMGASGEQQSAWVVAWTQNDSTKMFFQTLTNPVGAASSDPQTFAWLTGLVDMYGQVNIREYDYTFTSPDLAGLAADSGQQAVVNDTANWGTAP